MPEYLNTNVHVVYVDDPKDDSRDLTPIPSGETVEATGRFADNLEQTAGVYRTGSDEAKAYKQGVKVKSQTERVYPPDAEEVLATDGQHSFPANDQEIITPSDATPAQTPAAVAAEEHGRRVAEEQEAPKPNFASDEAAEKANELDLNPRDLADRTGSGKDGALTVKDVKQAAEELSTTPENLDEASEEQLLDMASEFGIDTEQLLTGVDDADRRETLQIAVEDAAGENTGGTVTSDKVPKAS